jgi:hypothetical protein
VLRVDGHVRVQRQEGADDRHLGHEVLGTNQPDGHVGAARARSRRSWRRRAWRPERR